jgi:hypothetical protein
MGIITNYEDVNTGLTIPNAYISLYSQVIKITVCDDRLVAQALTEPPAPPTNQVKKFNVDVIFNVYISKTARDSNKTAINKIQIQDGYTNDISKIVDVAYEELKKQYPTYSDD